MASEDEFYLRKRRVRTVDLYYDPEKKKRTDYIPSKAKTGSKSKTDAVSVSSPPPEVCSMDVTCEVPTEDSYVNELLLHNALIRLTGGTYIMPDYDLKKNALASLKFYAVRSKCIQIGHGATRFWYCSCIDGHWDFMENLPNSLSCLPDYMPCIHCSAARQLVLNFHQSQDHQYSDQVHFVEIPTVTGGVCVVQMSKPKEIGVTTVKYRLSNEQEAYLHCHSCRSDKCTHIHLIECELESEQPNEELATIDILLHCEAFEKQTVKPAAPLFPQKFSPFETEMVEIKMETLKPPSCDSCTDSHYNVESSCRVYYSDGFSVCNVYSCQCECGLRYYDGTNDPILNFGYYAVSHYLL